MNNSQIAHLWANKSRARGNGSHFFFDGDTIYSYGSHFPIARHYRNAILFTSNGYSSSTARHKSIVRGACSHLTIFIVSDPTKNPSAKDIKEYRARINRLSIEAGKARKPAWALQCLDGEIAAANSFCEYFGFKTRFSLPENIEALREKARAMAARDEQAQAAKQAKFESECGEIAQRWLAGEMVSIPYGYNKVLLRARSKDINGGPLTPGDARTWCTVMETSKGATVPLSEAEKAFRFVMLKRARGWHRNGETFPIGEFHLDSVNEQGVVAGCHRVTWGEIERFATAQHWAIA